MRGFFGRLAVPIKSVRGGIAKHITNTPVIPGGVRILLPCSGNLPVGGRELQIHVAQIIVSLLVVRRERVGK